MELRRFYRKTHGLMLVKGARKKAYFYLNPVKIERIFLGNK